MFKYTKTVKVYFNKNITLWTKVKTQDQYWTIHITPEDSFSYASFETNIPPTDNDSYELLVKKIYDVFKPKQFCLTIFWNEVWS